jgi:hypothetical protein
LPGAKSVKRHCSLEIDDDVQEIVKEILRDHPRLVDTVKGRSGADPFVIALAETTKPPFMVVLTEETQGKSQDSGCM